MKNLNLIFRILFLLNFLIHLSCQNPEPRRPINKQKKFFLKESAKRNKNIMAIEQSLFQQAIDQEKKLSFKNSPQGFWYAYKKKSILMKATLKKGILLVLNIA